MKTGIIIGAGIGGLTTAIALGQKGIKTAIFEQAEELKDIGAGIGVAPNGLNVFDKLGFADEVIASGKELTEISVVDTNQKPISIIDGNRVAEKHKFNTVAIHRGTLQSILKEKVANGQIICGKKFVSYSQTNDKVSVVFNDGSCYETDFLIIADGIKSNGRLQMNKNVSLRYSGQTCWRFIATFDFPESENGKMYEIWSNKKGLRVGYSQVNEREVYVFITNHERSGGTDDLLDIKSKLTELCSEFPEIVQQMIAQVPAHKIIRTDLYDFKPISNWVDNHVALLGDAAHATTPNLGQGACQAIEDAYVIADQLSQEISIERALLRYQTIRINKAKYITNTSWLFARMTNTTGVAKWLIKTALRMTPASTNEKQLDKIYSTEYL